MVPKAKNSGKGEVVKFMEVESEFKLIGIRVIVDEIPTLYIDKLNNKFVVGGINYLDDDGFL